MRIATFVIDEAPPRIGVVHDDRILDLAAAYRSFAGATGPASVLDLIRGGDAMLRDVGQIVRKAFATDRACGIFRDLASVRLLAPIPVPAKNVFCVGRNYKLHIEEGARARGQTPTYPAVPEFFTKPPTAVVGPEADIRFDPAITSRLDYEVELAFVIGRQCRDVPVERAAEVIFGYTVLNDITARDLQLAHGQWFKGKSLDTSCPIGPWIVTADAFGPAAGHAISLKVNGETRQSSSTADMLFDCAAIVASLSAGMTLEPGDIVTTGTPSGVGLGMSPQVWLQDGDVIEAEIEGVGLLRNTVRAVAPEG